MTQTETTDWRARRDAVAASDGAEWDLLADAFDTAWKATYTLEFLSFAVSRGWSQEDAENWSNDITDGALLCADRHGYDPVKTAQHDVAECEKECCHV